MTPSRRKQLIEEGVQTYREAYAAHARQTRLFKQLASHPDATDQQILETAKSVGASFKFLTTARKQLLDAVEQARFKHGMSCFRSATILDNLIP